MRYEIRLLRLLFPSVLFSTTVHGIHLTFDDGPHPRATPTVLRILKERNIQASFFLLGQNVMKFPELARQIRNDGHQIGNHSYTHSSLFFKNEGFIRNEILQSEEILQEIIGEQSRYFRPPYGYFTGVTLKVLQEYDLSCILWSVDSKDFQPTQLNRKMKRVIKKATDGSILLFHDNESTAHTVHSYLPFLLDALQEKGFNFKQLP